MGARSAKHRDLIEELARVKRRIDHAVYELSEARGQMITNPTTVNDLTGSESEIATICISLELSLADSVAWAQKLAEKVRGSSRSAKVTA